MGGPPIETLNEKTPLILPIGFAGSRGLALAVNTDAGQGTLVLGKTGKKIRLQVGDAVLIPPNTWHTVEANRGTSMRYFAVDCFAQRRNPAEPTWDAHMKVVCRQQGWDFSQVKKGRPCS